MLLEGSIFIAGAGVQWLRDKVKLLKRHQTLKKFQNHLNQIVEYI
jgi:glycerol kinase